MRLSINFRLHLFWGRAVAWPLAVTCLALWSAPLLGEDDVPSTPLSKVERKNKAPVSGRILSVELPKAIEGKLKNGVTVTIQEDHRFPTVFVEFHLGGAGPLFEPTEMNGLASVTAQMLREGTRSRTSKEIAEEVDRLGATLGAASGFGSTDAVLSASGLSDNFSAWFAVSVDVLLNPAFPADELAKLKQRLRVQLSQQRASPNFLLSERFNRAVFGTHPAAVVSPTPQSIDSLTPKALLKWHGERYRPQNTILAIAGDVRAKELIPKLEQWLGGWPRSKFKPLLPPNPVPAKARKVYLVDRPNSVQTTIALGNIAIERRSADFIPMAVMNRLLGGGPAARLFLNLREEKGYTYGVYSDFTAVKYPGPWRAGGNMRTEVTAEALVEFFNEIRRIRDEKVPGAELEESKRAIAASFALSLERPTRVLQFTVTRRQYGLPADYWGSYPARVMAVTADDVQRVARRYLNPDTMQLVAVGDAGRIKSILERYGPVELYSDTGNIIQTSNP